MTGRVSHAAPPKIESINWGLSPAESWQREKKREENRRFKRKNQPLEKPGECDGTGV